jgi:hypothetical protein
MDNSLTALEARFDTILPTLATKADIAELRGDFHRMDASNTRWIVATVISLFLGFAGLFLVVSNSNKRSAPAAQSTPIIIQVPQLAPSGSA